MAKDEDVKQEDKVLTAEEPKKEAPPAKAPPVEKKPEPKVEKSVEAVVVEAKKAPVTLQVLAYAIRFLAFKCLEPSELAEFDTRYPEIKG